MATAGELIRLTADALQVPEATVTSYHRMLREAGLLTKGGRGRNAPQMSEIDVARLLLAMLGADSLAEAAPATELVSELSSQSPVDFRDETSILTLDGEEGPIEIDPATVHYDPEDEPIELEEAVARLLSQVRDLSEGRKPATDRLPFIGFLTSWNVGLSVTPTSLTAVIEGDGSRLDFDSPSKKGSIIYPDEWMNLPVRERLIARAEISGIEIRRSVGWAALRKLAEALPKASAAIEHGVRQGGKS